LVNKDYASANQELDQILMSYAGRFQVLADPLRLKILLLLADGEKCVCELVEVLQLKQSSISYHLKLMVKNGIIKRRKFGTWHYYRLSMDIDQWLNQFCEWGTLVESVENKKMLKSLAGSCQSQVKGGA